MINESALLRALGLLHRYSVDITEIASRTLGRGHADNRTIQLFLLIAQDQGVSPSGLADGLGVSRSAVSRSLHSLEDLRMVSRRRAAGDRRGIELHLTQTGGRRVDQFARELADHFAEGAPLVADSLRALAMPVPRTRTADVGDAIRVAMVMAAAGASYVEEVSAGLHRFGVAHRDDRAALAVLKAHGRVRPGLLGHEVCASPPSVTALLDRLERGRLICRRRDGQADRRAVVVELTNRGEQAVQVILEVFARHAPPIMESLAHTLAFADRSPARGAAPS